MLSHKKLDNFYTEVLNVLVIEDEQRYREFLVDVLGEMKCAAVGVASAAEAERAIDERCPDVILLDLNLPVTDGMTFLRQFRQGDVSTPVIILTGVGDLPSAQQAIRLGVTEFLTKPCHLGQIEQAMDHTRRHIQSQKGRETESRHKSFFGLTETVLPIADVERETILAALRASNGNRSAAALELGISRRTLYSRLEHYRAEGIAIPGE